MTQPVANTPYQVTFYPEANGQSYDPQPAGGGVDLLEVLNADGALVTTAGPAARIVAGEYRFPPVSLPAGVYDTRITWRASSTSGSLVHQDRLLVSAFTGSLDQPFAWVPSPADVRALLLRRGTAAATDDEVQRIIIRLAASLRAETGVLLTERWFPVAHAYVVYAAAAQIEAALFPEQQLDDGSQADRLDRRAGAELLRLRTGLGLAFTGDGSGGGGTAADRRGTFGAVALTRPDLPGRDLDPLIGARL